MDSNVARQGGSSLRGTRVLQGANRQSYSEVQTSTSPSLVFTSLPPLPHSRLLIMHARATHGLDVIVRRVLMPRRAPLAAGMWLWAIIVNASYSELSMRA
jgi:hypothetical protein